MSRFWPRETRGPEFSRRARYDCPRFRVDTKRPLPPTADNIHQTDTPSVSVIGLHIAGFLVCLHRCRLVLGTNKVQDLPRAAEHLPDVALQPFPVPHKKPIKHRFAFDRFFLATTTTISRTGSALPTAIVINERGDFPLLPDRAAAMLLAGQSAVRPSGFARLTEPKCLRIQLISILSGSKARVRYDIRGCSMGGRFAL
jgi:hypothetical protein